LARLWWFQEVIEFVDGDLFEVEADVRVNTVNCVGVMGAGVALAFKEKYPEMFKEYRKACQKGEVRLGKMHLWKDLFGTEIVNFPTKRHWREKSRYEDLEAGLKDLRRFLDERGAITVTLPSLGCGHGGLDWTRVSKMIEEALEGVEARVLVFQPQDSRRIGEKVYEGAEALAKAGVEVLTNDERPEPLRAMGDQLYLKGERKLLDRPAVGLISSGKPTERESAATDLWIKALAQEEITLSLVSMNKAAQAICHQALDQGASVVVWLPEGMIRSRFVRELAQRKTGGAWLCVSLGRTGESWSRGLAARTLAALELSSRVILITDPRPRIPKEGWGDQPGIARRFFVKYQDTPAPIDQRLRQAGAAAVGMRVADLQPNLNPIMDALGISTTSVSPQNGQPEQTVAPADQPQPSDQVNLSADPSTLIMELNLSPSQWQVFQDRVLRPLGSATGVHLKVQLLFDTAVVNKDTLDLARSGIQDLETLAHDVDVQSQPDPASGEAAEDAGAPRARETDQPSDSSPMLS
jgi:O-acetyl-ADP-ribose deacetylase (regulator of RNase III)